MKRVAIIDYGMGNLASVTNAVRAVGGEPVVLRDPDALNDQDRIIVPGVGAFDLAIKQLRASGMGDALELRRESGVPVLGICLGMQLFCETSEEDGQHEGLGWIDAAVRRFPSTPGFKVPHMGWDDVHRVRDHELNRKIVDGSDFYFVHSYYVDCRNPEDELYSGDYGVRYCAAFARNNVAGAQFHPEKSQHAGLKFLANFLDWRPC